MRRGSVAYIALALIGLGVTGCGIVRYEQREPWRNQAEAACLAHKQVQPTAYMALAPAIDGPGACGMTRPFKISAFAGGSVGLASKVTLACPVIPRIDAWLEEVVQPAALLYFGERVAEIRSGSYSCRGRNNRRGARLSEHAFGNAVDVMSFRLAGGYDVPIARGWRGSEAEQDFLREVFVGACRYFTTVLGPGSDMFHYDHFHLDLARHDPHGQRHVCKPNLKFTPRVGTESARYPARPAWPEAGRGGEPDILDLDDDHDPFAATPTSARRTPRYAERRPAPGASPEPAPAPVRSGLSAYAAAEADAPLRKSAPLPRYGALSAAPAPMRLHREPAADGDAD